MSFVQRLFKAVLPRASAEAMETESRRWVARCPCGYERSLWDLGGIRWKASGNPRQFLTCPQCGQRGWHVITRKADGA